MRGFLYGLGVACALSLAVTFGFGLTAEWSFLVGLVLGSACVSAGMALDS